MNNNRGNNRRRGRGNNNRQQGGQQVNRIDSRARGNAPQLLEKYRKLAHDAHLNGDRVTEEYNLQFADHYFRVIADQRQRQEEGRQPRPDGSRWQESSDSYRDEFDGPEDSAGTYPGGDERNDYVRADREPRPDMPQQRPPADPSAEEADEGNESGEGGSERSVYEPAENPFTRDNRGTRGLKARRPRREPRERGDDAPPQARTDVARADDAAQPAATPSGFDPQALPPAIAIPRDSGSDEAGESAEPKPKRRTRRKPVADDAGEPVPTAS